MRGAWAAVVIAIAVLLLCGLAGCGRADAPVQDNAAGQGSLDAAQAPAGVDAELYARLQAALLRQLPPRVGSSSVPLGEASRVQDFKLQPTGEETVLASWTYRNPGDYNLDSKVAADDLAVLARYYGAKRADAAWLAAGVADGNGDGVVDEGDVSTVAANFGHSISGYYIQRATDLSLAEPWVFHASVLRQAGQKSADGARLEFAVELTPVKKYEYYSLQPYHISAQGLGYGLHSNIELYSGQVYPPPAPENLTATNGLRQDFVHLSWDPVPGATAYNVYRDGKLVNYSLYDATVWEDPLPTFFDDYSIPDGSSHLYAVKAINSVGEGPASQQASGSIILPAAVDTLPGDWVMCGHDAQHSFCSNAIGPEKINREWVIGGPGLFDPQYYTPPIFSQNGTLFLLEAFNQPGCSSLVALTETGQLLWRITIGQYGTAPLIDADGNIIVTSINKYQSDKMVSNYYQDRAYLTSIALNRSLNWQHVDYREGINYSTPSSLIADERGRLYWVTSPGLIQVLEPNGNLIWDRELDGYHCQTAFWNSMAVDKQGNSYLFIPEAAVLSFDNTGFVRWEETIYGSDENPFPWYCHGPIITQEQTIFLQGSIPILFDQSGTAAFPVLCNTWNEYVVPALTKSDNIVCVVEGQLGYIKANDVYSGFHAIDEIGNRAYILVDAAGKIYCLSDKLRCYGINQQLLWEDNVSYRWNESTALSMGNEGTLYVNSNGLLYAYSP